MSQKWPGSYDATVVRASIGRYGEEAVLQRADDELAELVRAELGASSVRCRCPLAAR